MTWSCEILGTITKIIGVLAQHPQLGEQGCGFNQFTQAFAVIGTFHITYVETGSMTVQFVEPMIVEGGVIS